MQDLDDIRLEAMRLDGSRFRGEHADPVLLLWQSIDGDLQFAAPGELEARPREGDTMVHVPRVSARDRVRGPDEPGRSRVAAPQWAPVRVTDGTRPLVVGRSRGRDIRLNDFTVSATHARIWGVPGTARAWIEDAGSRNGTAHNGVRLVEDFRSELVSGDELVVGKHVLLFLDPHDFYRFLRGELG